MTDQEFQQTVLQEFQKLHMFVGEQKEFNAKVSNFIEKQEEFNAKMNNFIAKQEEFNREQDEFNGKLFVVIENDVVEQLGGYSDEVKVYADKKVGEHEEKYEHVSAGVY